MPSPSCSNAQRSCAGVFIGPTFTIACSSPTLPHTGQRHRSRTSCAFIADFQTCSGSQAPVVQPPPGPLAFVMMPRLRSFISSSRSGAQGLQIFSTAVRLTWPEAGSIIFTSQQPAQTASTDGKTALAFLLGGDSRVGIRTVPPLFSFAEIVGFGLLLATDANATDTHCVWPEQPPGTGNSMLTWRIPDVAP